MDTRFNFDKYPHIRRLIAALDAKAAKPTRCAAPRSTISPVADAKDHPISVVIVLDLPHPKLSPNARPHCMEKAKLTREARDSTCAIVMRDLDGARPMWKSATIKLDFYFANKHKHDCQNLIAQVKAHVDGLQDAHLIEDDSGLTFLPVGRFVDYDSPRLQITVTLDAKGNQ